MIGDWAAQAPVLLAALGVLFLPGLVISWALGLRGLALSALAPAASVAVLSGLALVLGAAGIRWSPLSAGIGCLVVVAIALGTGWLLGPLHQKTEARRWWLIGAGIAMGVMLGATRVLLYIGEPAAISQTNDAVFHLNALRWIAEDGSASSFDLTGLTGSRVFYPGAWHAVASLTMLISGSSIPIAVNMVSVVIAAVVWPLGIAWLALQTSGSKAVVAAAAALSPTLLAFPMLMLQWGVLYPYFLSVALLPAAVAVVVAAPRWFEGVSSDTPLAKSVIRVGVVLLGAVAAVAFAQPATLLAWTVLAVAFVSWWAAPIAMRSSGRRRRLLLGAVAGAWLLGLALWFALTRMTTGSHWPPYRGKVGAVADILLNGQVMLPFAIAVSALMVLGLIAAVRRPDLRWLATGWLLLGVLFIVAAAIGQPTLRRWLVGSWYADPYRLAALAPVTVIPLAAIGLTWAIVGVMARVARRRGREPARNEPRSVGWWGVGVAAAIGAIGLVLAPIVMMPKAIEQEWDERSRYASYADSWLSPDERRLLEQLDKRVPADARVIGNPSTGTGFGFMLSGRDVYPRTWAHPRGSEWEVIQTGLRYAGTDPAVCEALEVYGDPAYVLDFGEGEATPGRFILPGMTGFSGQPGFEMIAAEGDASLWRVTACG